MMTTVSLIALALAAFVWVYMTLGIVMPEWFESRAPWTTGAADSEQVR
jgi:hypothetical protein